MTPPCARCGHPYDRHAQPNGEYVWIAKALGLYQACGGQGMSDPCDCTGYVDNL